MKTTIVIPCLLALATAQPTDNTPSVNAVAEANNDFTKTIYKHLLTSKTGKNIIFSPYSVSSVMAMVLVGAEGRTKNQIRSGMSLRSDSQVLAGYQGVTDALNGRQNEGFTLKTANKMFVQENLGLKDSFKKLTEDYFRAPVQLVDFVRNAEATRVGINGWVEDQTNSKIKDLLLPGSLDPFSRMVLVNAVYFKGTWQTQFDKENTEQKTFHVAPRQEDRVDMMFAEMSDVKIGDVRELDARALELPYKGNRLSMIILLPNDRYGLSQMEQNLPSFDLHGFRINSSKKVQVHLPKFRLESTHDLQDPLRALGITDMFDSAQADLSGIAGSPGDLYAGFIIQKAFIEVNEEGSEAAAATAVGLITRAQAFPSRPEVFRCDHPFMFFIKDNLTGMILFNGRVVNPSQ